MGFYCVLAGETRCDVFDLVDFALLSMRSNRNFRVWNPDADSASSDDSSAFKFSGYSRVKSTTLLWKQWGSRVSVQ